MVVSDIFNNSFDTNLYVYIIINFLHHSLFLIYTMPIFLIKIQLHKNSYLILINFYKKYTRDQIKYIFYKCHVTLSIKQKTRYSTGFTESILDLMRKCFRVSDA